MFFPGEIVLQTGQADIPLRPFIFPFTCPLDMVPGNTYRTRSIS